jgi:hypothetical protein
MNWKANTSKILYFSAIGIVGFFLMRLVWVNWDGFFSESGVGTFNLIGHLLLALPSILLWGVATFLQYNKRLSISYWLLLTVLFLISFLSKAHF